MEDSKVRVLLEEIKHQIKVIHKNTADNPARFDKLEKDVEEMKEDIAVIKLTLPNKANVADLELVKKDINLLKGKVGLKGA